MPAGGRAAGPAAFGSGGPAAADDVVVPAQDRVRGDQQPQSLAPRFRYHAEQSREQCPVRPVQVRAARLPPLQYGELVAQDQDLRAPPCPLRWDSRSHVVTRVMRRKANRRHMTCDHHGRGVASNSAGQSRGCEFSARTPSPPGLPAATAARAACNCLISPHGPLANTLTGRILITTSPAGG